MATVPAVEAVGRTAASESDILTDLGYMLATKDDKAIRKALGFYGVPIVATFLADDANRVEAALRVMHPDRRYRVFQAGIQFGEDERAAFSDWRVKFADLWDGMLLPEGKQELRERAKAFYDALALRGAGDSKGMAGRAGGLPAKTMSRACIL